MELDRSSSLCVRDPARAARARLRLHERLPRRRELDRHRRFDRRAASRRRRCVWAAFFNFVAIVVFHAERGRHGRQGHRRPGVVDHHVIFGALIGAIAWNLITWYYGIPSSSSHALIGGIVGAAVAKAGTALAARPRAS